MEISFVSSLTPEDEERVASAFLPALAGLLDLLPIAYSIRVKTASGKTLDQTHAAPGAREPAAAAPRGHGPVQHPLNPDTLDPLKRLLLHHPRR